MRREVFTGRGEATCVEQSRAGSEDGVWMPLPAHYDTRPGVAVINSTQDTLSTAKHPLWYPWSFYDLAGLDGGCGEESTRDGSETKMYFQVPLIVSIPSSFVLD